MKGLLGAIAAIVVLAGGTAHAGPGAAGHGHGEFSAGKPGNPKKPARVVKITMGEADGKMIFEPNRLEVRKGEQVRFVLQNVGQTDHEFVLGTMDENLKHAEVMRKHPEMEHDDPNAKRLAPGATHEILWRFTKAGTFDFSCLIPGHREAGMFGTVAVK